MVSKPNPFLLPLIISFALMLIGKTTTSAAAPVGNYLVLNGGYVKASNNNSVSPAFFSFHTKINPNTVSGKQIILSIGDKASGKLYYEIGINGGLLSASYNFNGFYTSLSAGNLVSGNWQDVAVEISSTQTKLLIDGKEVFSPFINNSSLAPIGPNIVVGDSFKESFFDSKPYKGLLDEVKISGDNVLIFYHLDEARGQTTAYDASGNNINGTLVGADNLIHFYGVLPTPTPFSFGFSPIQWTRPVLPTLSFPSRLNPTPTATQPPQDINPTPSLGIRDFPRPARPGRSL